MSLDSPESRPEVQALTTTVDELERFAHSFKVTTPDEYRAGAADLQRVKAAQRKLEEARLSLTGPINASLRRLNDFFRAPADRLKSVELTLKGRLSFYADEQERRRRELQRQADEQAAAAREKANREAAAARLKADQEAAALRAKAENEAAAGRQVEADRLAARADAKLERAEVKAESLQQAAAVTVAPVIQAEAPKVRGVVTREVWKFEVIDASRVAPTMMVPDEAKIRRTVAALKGDAGPVVGPGVRIWKETAIAAGVAQ
jgi:hypothetical protein